MSSPCVKLHKDVIRRRTAKVWKDFKLLYDLAGHQQSVWAVLAINSEQFLTGMSLNKLSPHIES